MRIDLTGKRFGRLVVLRLLDDRYCGQLLWLCRCDCGVEKPLPAMSLRGGRTRSCGCLRRELGVKRGTESRRHGEGSNGKETPEYRAWTAMLSRCRNVNHTKYADYGGRGIKVCARWESYEHFLADVGRRPSNFHTLDRIDNDGDYEPGNVRWATWEQQNNNQRPRGAGSKAQKRRSKQSSQPSS